MSPDRYLISLIKSAYVSMRISKHSNRKMAGVISFLSILSFLDIRSSPPHHLNHGYRVLPLVVSVHCYQREGAVDGLPPGPGREQPPLPLQPPTEELLPPDQGTRPTARPHHLRGSQVAKM